MSKLGKILLLFSGISLAAFAAFRILLGTWVPFLWVCLGLMSIFFLAAVWIDRGTYRDFFAMKTTKQGMSMGAMITTVLVLLVAVNFLAARKYKTFDFSTAKVNTLSDQSIKMLNLLNADLRVIYFYQQGAEHVEENRRAFVELMRKYQDQSAFVKLEFIDVNERPDLTEKYGVTSGAGVVFLDYKDRKSQIQRIDEQEITSALVKVTREKEKVVYFTVGHGERDLEDGKDANGAQFLKQLLEGNRYTVRNLNLTEKGEVPGDSDVIFVAGPRQSFLDREVASLESYLKKGGSLILALDSKKPHKLDAILKLVGLQAKDNYIVNFVESPIGRAVNPQVTTGSVFSGGAVTRSFGKSQFTVFRLPQEIEAQEPLAAGLRLDTLVKTGSSSMAYSSVDFHGEGKIGNFAVAQLVSGRIKGMDEKGPELTVAVFGNSEFLNNQLLYQNLNRDLILNTVASLVKEENLISITPKELGITKMQITSAQFWLFLFGFILLVPVILLGTSITMWFKRRYA